MAGCFDSNPHFGEEEMFDYLQAREEEQRYLQEEADAAEAEIEREIAEGIAYDTWREEMLLNGEVTPDGDSPS